jgi:predicted DNA-binding transcriptional regulator AlpA
MRKELLLLYRHQLAEMFGVHVNTIDNYVKRGWLKPIRLGKLVKFNADEIDFNNFPQTWQP